MAIDESRKDCFPMQIDRFGLGSSEFHDAFRIAHVDDTIAKNRKSFRCWMRSVHGNDVGVKENEGWMESRGLTSSFPLSSMRRESFRPFQATQSLRRNGRSIWQREKPHVCNSRRRNAAAFRLFLSRSSQRTSRKTRLRPYFDLQRFDLNLRQSFACV